MVYVRQSTFHRRAFAENIDSVSSWRSHLIVIPALNTVFSNGARPMLPVLARVREASTCPVMGAAAQYAFHALEAFRLPTRLASSRPRVSTRNIDKVRPTTPRDLVTQHLCAITHENSLSRSVSDKRPRRRAFRIRVKSVSTIPRTTSDWYVSTIGAESHLFKGKAQTVVALHLPRGALSNSAANPHGSHGRGRRDLLDGRTAIWPYSNANDRASRVSLPRSDRRPVPSAVTSRDRVVVPELRTHDR